MSLSLASAEPLVLEASRLSVGWEGRPVLCDVDLSVRSGETVALVGSNGSGKTTLLRAFAGILPVLGGELSWLGDSLPRGSARCKVVAFVFQAESPSHFTVRELVTMGLALDGPPSQHDAQRVAQVLEAHDLDLLAERRCTALSGGEWRRCVLARALVAEPALLLLDEPTNHLDPARRVALHERLARLGRRALVVATHDLELAALCDRVVVLADGRVAATGHPSAVLVPEVLRRSLGVNVRRLDDPEGGPPLFRVVGSCSTPLSRRAP